MLVFLRFLPFYLRTSLGGVFCESVDVLIALDPRVSRGPDGLEWGARFASVSISDELVEVVKKIEAGVPVVGYERLHGHL